MNNIYKPLAVSSWPVAILCFVISNVVRKNVQRKLNLILLLTFLFFSFTTWAQKSSVRADSIIAKNSNNTTVGIVVSDTIGSTGNTALVFKTNNTERMRITSSGSVGIGITNPVAPLHMQTEGTTGSGNDIILTTFADLADPPAFTMIKNRGTISSPSLPLNNDGLGGIWIQSNAGTAATMVVYAEGDHTTGKAPANLRFTTTNSLGSNLERMRIDSGGRVGIGTNGAVASSALLELASTNKGLLLPRMTTANRNAIVSPIEGLILYNTTTHCVDFYNGIVWISTCSNNDNTTYCGGDSLVDTRNGVRDVYSVKWYGPAGCWMTQNLRYFNSIGGMRINPGINVTPNTSSIIVSSLDDIHNTNTASKNIAYAEGSIINNDVTRETFTMKFGLLYRWDSAMLGNTIEGAQGICPAGWHIPGDAEFSALEKEISNNPAYGDSGTWQTTWDVSGGDRPSSGINGHARLLKSDSLVYGQANGTLGTSTFKWSGTGADGGLPSVTIVNASKFNAFPNGFVDKGAANCIAFGNYASWWTSSIWDANNAWDRYLNYNTTSVFRQAYFRDAFFAIRCKKN